MSTTTADVYDEVSETRTSHYDTVDKKDIQNDVNLSGGCNSSLYLGLGDDNLYTDFDFNSEKKAAACLVKFRLV